MPGISKINSSLDFVSELAAKYDKKIMTLPLKNDEIANILYNKNSVDCFITKEGSLIGATGASGHVDYVIHSAEEIMKKLQKHETSDINVCLDTIKAYFKNIK